MTLDIINLIYARESGLINEKQFQHIADEMLDQLDDIDGQPIHENDDE